jgi:hypothetical protein
MSGAPRAARSTNRLLYITLALAAICLLGLFSSEIADTDFWWHLRTGQFIVERHSLPVPDPFSYTTALQKPAPLPPGHGSERTGYSGEEQIRHFNLTHEWLSQVLMYFLYLIGGFPAIDLFRAAMLTAVCGLSGFLAWRFSGNAYVGIAAAFATASIAVEFRADRPTLVTFLFVPLFVTILEVRRALWVLVPLSLLWANCHGGFFMGWVVLLAYCAGAVFEQDRLRVWIVAACSIVISGLNPNGIGVISTLFEYRRSQMQGNLIEWHAPYLWGPPYAFNILLYASAAVLISNWRKVRLAHWLLYAAFTGASLLAFRNILLIGFLAPVLIAAYFRPRLPKLNIAWAVPVVLLIGIAVGVERGSVFQLHVAGWKIPVGAADYLAANHITAPMFNTYEEGGYLIWKLWPQERVFTDGRALSESVNRDYRQILYNMDSAVDQMTGPRAELLDRYGVQVVAMNTLEYVSGAVYPLALSLGRPENADWQLVFDDAQALVFLRRPPAGTPVYPDKLQRVLQHMDTECAAYIEHSPGTPMCARTLADYWLRNGLKDRGREMLRLYLAHAPERDEEAERVWRQIGGGPLP